MNATESAWRSSWRREDYQHEGDVLSCHRVQRRNTFSVIHVEEGVDGFDNIRVGVDNEASFTGKEALFSQEFTVRRNGEC